MTRVLVHLVLHCVFSTRIGPLKVTSSACVCTHAQYVTACNAHLRCANQGIVRILLLPGANAPNVHVRHGKEPLWHIYGMPGVKGQTLGGPGARPSASTTDTVCLIWPKGQRSKSGPEPAPHLLLMTSPIQFPIFLCLQMIPLSLLPPHLTPPCTPKFRPVSTTLFTGWALGTLSQMWPKPSSSCFPSHRSSAHLPLSRWSRSPYLCSAPP